jgi:16S rRNA (guanine(966)-N(2))-methyltransferase RsmD
MRIIAGHYRGRSLKTLRGLQLRPTSDRLRETLFNVLGPAVPGSVFVDCYAGSGAVGLEALSRGAAQVYLIEGSAPAIRVIGENLSALGEGGQAHLLRAPARGGLRLLEQQGVRADICFLDPPYAARRDTAGTLDWLGKSRLMAAGGVLIIEHGRQQPFEERFGEWRRARLLTQGSSALSFYRRAAGPDDSPRAA